MSSVSKFCLGVWLMQSLMCVAMGFYKSSVCFYSIPEMAVDSHRKTHGDGYT